MVSLARMDASIRLSEITMSYRRLGEGPLLVLLHGWPETSHCWRKIAPILARQFTVVAPDLRGYGATDKPTARQSSSAHGYSKRRMAQDIRELVDALGYDRVQLVGHDRGARVAHRFALDHADVLDRLTVLDIAPTLHMFRNGTVQTAAGFWHWLFHQRSDLPELLVGPNIDAYLSYFFNEWAHQRIPAQEALTEYVAAYSQPGALRASFDDYRATAQDLEDDQGDFDAGHILRDPVQVLWGEYGLVGGTRVLDAWKPFAPKAFGGTVESCGHFIPEERPDELARLLLEYHGPDAGAVAPPSARG